MPAGWPNGNQLTPAVASGGQYKSSSGSGELDKGVKVAIAFAVLIVVGLWIFMVYTIRRGRRERAKDQNAIKDQSEALQLDADGTVLRESIKSLKAHSAEQFDFESHPGDEDSVEVERPKTPTSETSSQGGGHGRII